jgi:hypothetical protein
LDSAHAVIPTPAATIDRLGTALDNLALAAANDTPVLQQLTASNWALSLLVTTLTAANKKLAEALAKAKLTRASARRRLNKLDTEIGQYMRYTERKCHKIKLGQIPFSPKASLWIRRTQVYRSLLKYHAGRIKNRGNIKRTARQCKIMDAMSLSIEEIYLRLKACVDQCDHFRKNGK